MPRSIADELRRLGFKDEQIAGALVDGKPLAEVDRPKPSKTPDGMNKTEAAYAIELDWLKREGAIAGYWFESIKFKLARKTTYTPDFCVLFPDGRIQFVEIKGFLRDDAAIKFKLAREKFPQWEFIMLRKVKREWVKVNI